MVSYTQPPEGDSIPHKRAYWRSRRGMSELENWLLPYVVHRFEALPTEDQHAYLELLEQEDWDVFDWLQERSPAPTEAFQRLVDDIRTFRFSDAFPTR
ncbi:MAG: succinate dehydrogenase assembly factor 2 [Pseudomonadota bacterium]